MPRIQSGGSAEYLIAPTPPEGEGSPVGLSGGQTETTGKDNIGMAAIQCKLDVPSKRQPPAKARGHPHPTHFAGGPMKASGGPVRQWACHLAVTAIRQLPARSWASALWGRWSFHRAGGGWARQEERAFPFAVDAPDLGNLHPGSLCINYSSGTRAGSAGFLKKDRSRPAIFDRRNLLKYWCPRPESNRHVPKNKGF